MSLGHVIAIHAVPFFELLDREVKSVADAVFGPGGDGRPEVVELVDAAPPAVPSYGADTGRTAVRIAMETSRRHLARGADAFVRRLPAAVRADAAATRAAAYALAGLADERMLHYPAGELAGWRERLLEYELYGSALAGQEIIRQARDATQGGGDASGLLAPLYLALMREGFEGSLRGDTLGLSSLISTLEDAVGAAQSGGAHIASDVGPRRLGLSAESLAAVGFAVWLASGVVLWSALGGDALDDAHRVAARIESGLSATFDQDPERAISPSRLPLPGSSLPPDTRPFAQ